MQILMFGYAINTDVRNLKTAVADEANTHLSREFITQVGETQVADVRHRVDSVADLEELLRTGDISIGISIPPDFDRRVIDPNRAAAHILVDGSDPTVLGVANQLRNMPVAFDSNSPGSKEPFGDRSPALLQPGTSYPGEYRTWPHGRHSDNDDDDLHGGCHRSRTRARQP